MKVPNLIIAVLLTAVISQSASAQTQQQAPLNNSGFQLSVHGGYDLPFYWNNTPYIDYKGGLTLGAGLDYYWHWFGIGTDFDYIRNRPLSTYPTTNLTLGGSPLTTFNLTEDRITRLFYGLGPDFKYQPGDKFSAVLKLRGGLADIKGGRTYLQGVPALGSPVDLNFHGGYDQNFVLSAKAQLEFRYFITDYIGLHAGAYYLHHFNAEESVDPLLNISAGYQPFVTTNGTNDIIAPGMAVRNRPCDCEIGSVGLFAGLTFRFPKRVPKAEKCSVCDNYSLTVTARDKFTKELLANTDVVVKTTDGQVAYTGTTNSFGVVSFNNINANDYTIEGVLYEVALDGATCTKSEFRPKENLQKQILYSDLNFILKGKVVVCNSAIPLKDVTVVLKNNKAAEQKNTMTDVNGQFIFHVKQQTDYQIYGKKDQYISQTETVSTSSYDRNATLFVKLEICMEKADCDKAVVLKNILYDLDKSIIKEVSKPELNRLVQFMTDNPGIRVELRSHTDSRGSHAYNEKLSQARADAAVNYLVTQGIARDRLVGKGYGETQLLNECADGVNCSEEKHQLNRRTEMKVICPDRN